MCFIYFLSSDRQGNNFVGLGHGFQMDEGKKIKSYTAFQAFLRWWYTDTIVVIHFLRKAMHQDKKASVFTSLKAL